MRAIYWTGPLVSKKNSWTDSTRGGLYCKSTTTVTSFELLLSFSFTVKNVSFANPKIRLCGIVAVKTLKFSWNLDCFDFLEGQKLLQSIQNQSRFHSHHKFNLQGLFDARLFDFDSWYNIIMSSSSNQSFPFDLQMRWGLKISLMQGLVLFVFIFSLLRCHCKAKQIQSLSCRRKCLGKLLPNRRIFGRLFEAFIMAFAHFSQRRNSTNKLYILRFMFVLD